MLKETEDILCMQIDYLPLKSYNHIVEGNALTIDWKNTFKDANINYIMGNPPFVGARLMSESQKSDLNNVFQGWKNVGDLDYVCCWYKKCVEFIDNTNIKVALVSTNSVCQGDSVAILWKPLFEKNIEINFAYKTFRWNSESNEKAKVHCVIIGFSYKNNISKSDSSQKIIYEGNRPIIVSHINAYLVDANDIFVESINKPLCDVPEIGIGNKPIDGGNYLFTEEEKDEFIKKEPRAEKYFKLWYGADEFINNRPRYCLYLGECSPSELKSMPECMKRVENVKQLRLESKSKPTNKLAETPTKFHVTNIPNSNYMIIPRVSSERRRYIPMGYLDKDILTSDSAHILPNTSLYHFGILTSNVHMAWMRAVAGRLEMRYRYSKDIVYNNFPWPIDISKGKKNLKDFEKKLIKIDYPTIDKEQKNKIEETAKQILEARKEFKDSSLADLYDETMMPDILRKAHRENDKLVMRVYNFKISHTEFTEEDCVGALMKLYKEIIDAKK